DLEVDGPGRVVEAVGVFAELERLAVVDADALEDAVAVEQAVVVDADLGVGLLDEFAVDVDAGAAHGENSGAASARPKTGLGAGSTRPAAIRTTRSVPATRTRLWVTMTIVRPSCRFKPRRNCITSPPLSASMLPVGSSASRMRGRLTRARAMAV